MDKVIEILIELLKNSEINEFVIVIFILICGIGGIVVYEFIKFINSKALLDIKKKNYKAMQNEQQSFQARLTQFNADLQEKIQTALEEQRVEFQKELQAIDYKNDYYKKIIDKRIEAYEKIIKQLFELNKFLGYKNKSYPMFISDKNSLKNITLFLDVFNEVSFWMSDDTRKMVKEFSLFLACIGNTINGDKESLKLENYINNKMYLNFDKALLEKCDFETILNRLKDIEKEMNHPECIAHCEEYKLELDSVIIGMAVAKEWIIISENIIIKCYQDFKNIDKVYEFLDR